MTEENSLASAEGGLLGDLGESAYGRRLSDKILTAFNHAYAQGRREIADLLLQSLNHCRQIEGAERVSGAMAQARKWMRYIQARDRYVEAESVLAAGETLPDDLMSELEQAYAEWQAG